MKKLFFALALTTLTASAYCQTAGQKVMKADDKVDSAQARLDRAKQDQAKASETYRADAKRQIENNEKEIDRLKGTMVKPLTSPENDATRKKVEALQERNADLRNKIEK